MPTVLPVPLAMAVTRILAGLLTDGSLLSLYIGDVVANTVPAYLPPLERAMLAVRRAAETQHTAGPGPLTTLADMLDLNGQSEVASALRAAMEAEQAAPESDHKPRTDRLEAFLRSAFSAAELRRMLADLPDGGDLLDELPGDVVPYAQLVRDAIAVLERRGLLGVPLIDRLQIERPSRAAEVLGWATDLTGTGVAVGGVSSDGC
jgi:hypothetical protein